MEMLFDRLRPKLKKRIKMKDIENRFLGKVNLIDFKKHVDKMESNLQIIEDKVEYKLPAMDYEFKRALKNKVDMAEVEALFAKKEEK